MTTNLGNATENTGATGTDELAQQAQSLHDFDGVAEASSNVDTDADAKPAAEPASAIQRLIAQYKEDPARNRPVTLREYLARMQTLPRLAVRETPVNGFTTPGDLNQSTLRLVTGLITSRLQRSGFQKDLDKPVSIVREMLLLCFEAKPRQMSFALSGYTASDFIAYIYQDVVKRDMDPFDEEPNRPFAEMVEDIKDWMRIPPAPSTVNTARRHIRRRLMATLDRSNHQASSLMEDREMPSEVLYLVQKLLERDDDQGYTRGDLRDYREVRDDLNALSEHCLRVRYEEGSPQIQDLEMVCCPSEVKHFESHSIQRRRGRPTKDESGRARAKKTAATKKAAAPKPSGKPKQNATTENDDFGLEALKNLV